MDWRSLLVAAGMLCASGQGIAGQSQAVNPANARAFALDPRLRVRLEHVRPGAMLRVRVAGGPRLTAPYAGAIRDSIYLQSGAFPSTGGAIDSIWTRQRSILRPALRGAWSGAVMGTAIQLIRGLRASCRATSLASKAFPLPACRLTVVNLGRAAASGALVGGAIGMGIGAAVPTWKLTFSATPSRSR